MQHCHHFIPDIHFSLANDSLPLPLVVNDTNPKIQLVRTLPTYLNRKQFYRGLYRGVQFLPVSRLQDGNK